MTGDYLIGSLLCWGMSVTPVLRGRFRRAKSAELRHGTEPDAKRTLGGVGVMKVHETTHVFDFFGLCGQPLQSISGRYVTDITCRRCKSVRRKAWRNA